MATLTPRWLVFSSALVLAPICACTLQIPDDPGKVRLPSCDEGKILFTNPDGWGCVVPDGLGATQVAEAAHARSAEVVDQAPSADHAAVAAVGTRFNPSTQVALGFEGPPTVSLDIRQGGIQVDGWPVPANLGSFFLSLPPSALPPGASSTSPFPNNFEVHRTEVLHLRARGTMASAVAAVAPLADSPMATCVVELSVVGPDNATDVYSLGWTTVSAFQSAAELRPASWFVEGEATNFTLAPGTYQLQLKVTNVSIASGAPCVLQDAQASLSFY